MTQHQKSDKYFKYFLLFVALFFLAHIGYALAQTVPPTIQCTSNGMGTIICYPI
jgi:hypothetical protein